MSSPPPSPNYTDPSGNTYYFNSGFSLNGTITPNGYHFKNTLATAQFVAEVIWLACFTSITVGICCVRSRDKNKPAGTTASYKYLRWPVIGASTLCIVLIYTLQIYNRIVHEIRRPIRWYYPAAIGVSTTSLTNFASGLLVAFLLWQLTPILLLYGAASPRRTKWTILLCRLLTYFISLLNTADTVVTAMLWVLNLQKAYYGFEGKNTNQTEKKVTSISNINDAALTASFTGMYLVCILIFAAVARLALKHLDPAPPRFKPALTLLTLGIICRSALDFAWALVFKVFALRPTLSLGNVLMTNLVHTALYGFFSVVVYACILFVAMAPLPDGVDHSAVGVQYLPKDKRGWHPNVRRSLRLGGHGAAVPLVQEQWKGGVGGVAVEEVKPMQMQMPASKEYDAGVAAGPGPTGYWGAGGGYAGWGSNVNADAGGGNRTTYRDGVEYQAPLMQGRW